MSEEKKEESLEILSSNMIYSPCHIQWKKKVGQHDEIYHNHTLDGSKQPAVEHWEYLKAIIYVLMSYL